jgi:UDP-glucose 4-epimerase
VQAVILGSSGVIGHHVMTAFASSGHAAIGVDLHRKPNQSSGWQIRADITSASQLDALAREIGQADVVCCLAGSGDATWCNDNPSEALAANVETSARAVDLAQALNASRVMIASTWEVYGQDAAPVATERSRTNPHVPYGAIKLAAERFAVAVAATRGMPTVVIRMGSAYGPGMRIEGALSAFVKAGISGVPIRVNGGDQRRSFTYVSDIADAWVLLAELDVVREIYNASAAPSCAIAELARLVATRFDVDIEFSQPKTDEPPSLTISSEALFSDTGWVPRVEIGEGLTEVERWLRGSSGT